MIENGYKSPSIIIAVKQNSGGYEDEYIRSRERMWLRRKKEEKL